MTQGNIHNGMKESFLFNNYIEWERIDQTDSEAVIQCSRCNKYKKHLFFYSMPNLVL